MLVGKYMERQEVGRGVGAGCCSCSQPSPAHQPAEVSNAVSAGRLRHSCCAEHVMLGMLCWLDGRLKDRR